MRPRFGIDVLGVSCELDGALPIYTRIKIRSALVFKEADIAVV